MRERPILFSAPMVRALLAGTKTQTRRVAKPKRSIGPMTDECPYGQPGDRLWVRESFWGCDAPGWGDQPCVVYDDEWHGKEYRPAEVRPWARKFGRIPSIHMPRDCSRITLEITAVGVERLHEISEADAIAEGIDDVTAEVAPSDPEFRFWRRYRDGGWNGYTDNAIASYASLWTEINGQGSWEANPWVWVVEFRVLHPRTDGGGRG